MHFTQKIGSCRQDLAAIEQKTECPMSGNCCKESVVYPATVSQSIITLPKPTWTGMENSLKTRYSNHKSSFSKANKCHNTELGKYIWYLKENLTKFKVKWRILQHTASSNRTSNRCNLCLWEKYFIICKPDLASLNKRNELISSCRHTSKYALENFTPKVLFLFLLLCFVLFFYNFSCHAIHTHFFEKVTYLLATVARAFQISLLKEIRVWSFYLMSSKHQLCCTKLNSNKITSQIFC